MYIFFMLAMFNTLDMQSRRTLPGFSTGFFFLFFVFFEGLDLIYIFFIVDTLLITATLQDRSVRPVRQKEGVHQLCEVRRCHDPAGH